MKHYTGCDAHKKYSVFTTISEAGEIFPAKRVEHDRQKFRSFLETLPTGSSIAIKSVGNWYWLIDEMEKAGHKPSLVHAGKAKLKNRIHATFAKYGVTLEEETHSQCDQRRPCYANSQNAPRSWADPVHHHSPGDG